MRYSTRSSALSRCTYARQDLEDKTALRTFCPVNNGSSTCSGDSVVVGLPEPSDGADACFGEEVHGQVTQALLSDHNIGLVLDDLCADLLDVVFLHLQQCSPASTRVTMPCLVIDRYACSILHLL